MEITLILALALALTVTVLAGLAWLRRPEQPIPDPGAAAERAGLEARLADQQDRLLKVTAELEQLRPRLEAALEQRAAAEAQLGARTAELEQARANEAASLAALKAAEQLRVQAERQAALAQQKLLDFEALRDGMTQAAKAATLDAGRELMGKLIEDHKREAEEVRRQGEETLKQTTETLFQQFQQVSGNVAAVTAQVAQLGSRTEVIHRALSHPGGAGRLAEIGLENLLKSFGLQPGQDFIVQYHAAADQDRGALRPDAVVFLPNDAVLVIDSKSSKSLLDHAEAETEAGATEALDRFSRSMGKHLKDLSSKEYRNRVVDDYKKQRRGGELKRAILAMALPNDAAVEKLRLADPTFERRAQEVDIVIAGPSALSAIIAFARMDIDADRQTKNYEQILDAVRKLMESTVTVLGHAEKAANGLQAASENFGRFTSSVNGRLLPRLRKLAKLGIRPAKGALPAPLAQFDVTRREADDVIDAEAEEVSQPQLTQRGPDTGS